MEGSFVCGHGTINTKSAASYNSCPQKKSDAVRAPFLSLPQVRMLLTMQHPSLFYDRPQGYDNYPL